MVDQILAAYLRSRREMRQRIIRYPSHHAALVVPRKKRERRPLRHVFLRFTLGHINQEKRQGLQEAFLREHLTVEELHRVFPFGERLIRQSGVVPSEVLLSARVRSGHYIGRVSG